MRNTARSFMLGTAAVFVVLFFGTAAPKALAQNERPRGSAYGRSQAPQENVRRNDRQSDNRSLERQYSGGRYSGGRYYGGRYYGGRYYGGFDNRVYAAPYRTVRVFVAFPFPHWILRQVYADGSFVVGPGCNPY